MIVVVEKVVWWNGCGDEGGCDYMIVVVEVVMIVVKEEFSMRW